MQVGTPVGASLGASVVGWVQQLVGHKSDLGLAAVLAPRRVGEEVKAGSRLQSPAGRSAIQLCLEKILFFFFGKLIYLF